MSRPTPEDLASARATLIAAAETFLRMSLSEFVGMPNTKETVQAIERKMETDQAIPFCLALGDESSMERFFESMKLTK